MVLNVPFMAVVAGTVFALYGSDAPAAFATIFFDPASSVRMDPLVLLAVSLVAVVPFMLINAPTEELVFRGYGLGQIGSRWGAAAGIVATSLLFGAQHVLFAATVSGMLVYFIAFTVWGLCAAIIVRRQGRLFPVVIAHWIVNVMMSSPAIVFPVLQLAGAIPA
ncbi:MAG: CPBP family intramembrane metalloprotease [Propionicimonas sp.]